MYMNGFGDLEDGMFGKYIIYDYRSLVRLRKYALFNIGVENFNDRIVV